jgi:hypothetical protein
MLSLPVSLVIDLLVSFRSPAKQLQLFSSFLLDNPSLPQTYREDCQRLIDLFGAIDDSNRTPRKAKTVDTTPAVVEPSPSKPKRSAYSAPQFFPKSNAFGPCSTCNRNLEKGVPKYVWKKDGVWLRYCPLKECLPGSEAEKANLWDQATAWNAGQGR